MCAKIKTTAVKPGSLCIVEINGLRIIGHYFADVEGVDWLIQPHRWIRITNPADVKVIRVIKT
jgi:hypothetical protein